jgi:hypothetical protein
MWIRLEWGWKESGERGVVGECKICVCELSKYMHRTGVSECGEAKNSRMCFAWLLRKAQRQPCMVSCGTFGFTWNKLISLLSCDFY